MHSQSVGVIPSLASHSPQGEEMMGECGITIHNIEWLYVDKGRGS